ncbi:50S ribosomal protein L10 [Clostridium luticellarii]|uniref:Large ribosomal subunit protein uL10 n=1 Tax=Clostridium luticellarii TaxID=1691940 RepID=A0A2T0BS52_9CLOT|nr:50S ribosomal protein L10 [Clostridium luticellarii]MCI1944677.1 50S ribosomal protein L10 [Clostridium luticellarii]MCI1968174.1 50S ribosomal protein L10 [Clostridium luticellarii]MCI1995281.1 50S ribosomal protein L10 [Clostridium luticellarii]MCI2039722.1 50S ribosomal protein L10 [Clostridium luticellarii]PRR86703.1 50S ribosomal protein L10 [Clostridium luticellarii]
MGKNREVKEAKVKEIKEKMEKAQSIIFAKYQGLTVEEDTKLRKNLREAGVEYKVYKNTLAKLAAKELGFDEVENVFAGPISTAFGYDDPAAPARVLNDFSKDHKMLELKGGVVQGEIFDIDKVKQLATIPPKDVLIAKLLGSFKAPLSNFVYLINAISEKQKSQED